MTAVTTRELRLAVVTVVALVLAMPSALGVARSSAGPGLLSPVDPYCDTESPVPADHVLVHSGLPVARLAALSGAVMSGHIPELGAWELRFADSFAARRGVVQLQNLPGTSAQVESTYRVQESAAGVVPNDPLLTNQWGLRKIHAYTGWDRELGLDNPVTVAVIDTGIDLQHPDLAGRVGSGFNAIDPTASAQDDMMHGTHVAGIIGAASDNRVGVAGMSWGARLMPVKSMNSQGVGTTCDIITGMVWAVANGAQVLNLSLGADEPCPLLLQAAVNFATQRNAVTVVAAGNAAKQRNPSLAPGNCSGVITVGATDQKDKPAVFSDYGPQVTVSAPGVHILSTYIDPKKHQHKYAYLDGTSMAAPFVAGLCALLLAAHPDWTPAQVRGRLVATAVDLGPKGWDPRYGYGRVDVARALAAG
jgi:subtilisin family serine protease